MSVLRLCFPSALCFIVLLTNGIHTKTSRFPSGKTEIFQNNPSIFWMEQLDFEKPSNFTNYTAIEQTGRSTMIFVQKSIRVCPA